MTPYFWETCIATGKVVDGLGGEEDVDGLLGEGGIALGLVDLDDVQLGAVRVRTEKVKSLESWGAPSRRMVPKSGGVTLDGLADAAVLGIELHGADYAALLLGDADHGHPFAVGVGAVVDDLATLSLKR